MCRHAKALRIEARYPATPASTEKFKRGRGSSLATFFNLSSLAARVIHQPISGFKGGGTLCLAMISIGSGLKLRASPRCRNNCLTLEMENGALANFLGERATPIMLRPGAGGVRVSRPFSIVVGSSSRSIHPNFCGSKAGATFCLAMISIVDRLKPRASQRCRKCSVA